MRYLILSDLHANLEAFEAVASAVEEVEYDSTVLLGDLVGYGASPGEVIDRVCEWRGSILVVRGNHDKVVAGLESATAFNPIARSSAEWTREQISEAQIETLKNLPAGPIQIEDGYLACHGSPQDEDLYLLGGSAVAAAFGAAEEPCALFGHTHIAGVFERRGDRIVAAAPGSHGAELELEDEVDYLINPGAVGQPRDGDPRAAFGVLDCTRRVFSWHRVEYDVRAARRRILESDLPPLLAERLEVGA